MTHLAQAKTPWQPFHRVAMALVFGVMSTALISPLFPMYEESWHITSGDVTVIFVAYMVGVLGALLFLGKFTDYLGPLKALKLSVSVMTLCILACAFAPNVFWLIIIRVLIGIASGIVVTAGTLCMTVYEPKHFAKSRAAEIGSVLTMLGFGLGPFVGGILAQFLWLPLKTTFIVTAIPMAWSVYGLYSIKDKSETTTQKLSFIPQFVLPPPPKRNAFLVASLSVFTAYAFFALIASLAPSFLSHIVPWHGPFVAGTSVAAVLFLSSGIQFVMRRFDPKFSITLGLIGMAVGILLLGAALLFNSSTCFFVSILVIGCSHGTCFMSAMIFVNILSKGENRSGMLCSFFSISYLGSIFPTLIVGALSDKVGLTAAVVIFSLVFAAFILSIVFYKQRLFKQYPLLLNQS